LHLILLEIQINLSRQTVMGILQSTVFKDIPVPDKLPINIHSQSTLLIGGYNKIKGVLARISA